MTRRSRADRPVSRGGTRASFRHRGLPACRRSRAGALRAALSRLSWQSPGRACPWGPRSPSAVLRSRTGGTATPPAGCRSRGCLSCRLPLCRKGDRRGRPGSSSCRPGRRVRRCRRPRRIRGRLPRRGTPARTPASWLRTRRTGLRTSPSCLTCCASLPFRSGSIAAPAGQGAQESVKAGEFARCRRKVPIANGRAASKLKERHRSRPRPSGCQK